MNIVYISKYTILPGFGSPTRQYFISKYLSKIPGNKVLLIGSRSTLGKIPKIKGLYQIQKEDKLEMITLNGPEIELGFNLKRLWSWVIFEINIFRFRKKIKAFKPDFIIVSSLSIFTFLSGVSLKKWLHIPLAVEVRDIYPLTLIEVGNYSHYNPAVIMLKWIERFGYKHADLIISTLPNAAKHINSILKRSFQFYWLPMGIDLDYYSDVKASVYTQKLYKKKSGEFVVGYAGSFGKANALDEIFEAAKILDNTHPHIKFVLIGEGPLKSFYQEKYKSLRNIFFFSAVPKLELQELLQKTDILINTWLDKAIYRFGISPNKWIDYMYAAKPIVVAFNGYKCIIDEAACGIFIPAQNTEALANAIIGFSKMNEEELNSMGAKGKKYLINKLSYEHLSNDFYKKLLSVQKE